MFRFNLCKGVIPTHKECQNYTFIYFLIENKYSVFSYSTTAVMQSYYVVFFVYKVYANDVLGL